MKRILLLILMTGLVLTSCSSGLVFVNIPTANSTGTLYSFGNALAGFWNQELDGVKVNVQSSGGGIDNLNIMARGEAGVSMAIVSNVYQSYHGLDKFEGRPNEDLRIITGLYYNPNQLVVSSNAGIEELSDLKGKRFVPGAPGSTAQIESSIHLEAAGLDPKNDLTNNYVSFSEAIDLFSNKQVDGAWMMAGVPTAAVTEILTTTNSELLEIPEDLIKSLHIDYPWYSNYTIPAGTYEKIDKDINTSAVKMVMFTRADMDDETIYKLTKSFWENIDEIKAVSPVLKDVTIENGLKDIAGLPIHDGAQKYYKEIGVEFE